MEANLADEIADSLCFNCDRLIHIDAHYCGCINCDCGVTKVTCNDHTRLGVCPRNAERVFA